MHSEFRYVYADMERLITAAAVDSMLRRMGMALKPTRLIQRQRRDAIQQQLAMAGKDGGESRLTAGD
jgi:hypothetical protein